MSHSFFDTGRWLGISIPDATGADRLRGRNATFYALKNAEDRGQFFISPGTKVYKGMIIGEYNRPQDLEINVCKTKQLTNMRSAGADELDTLQAPVQMTLERALEYIGPGEMLEVTRNPSVFASCRPRRWPSADARGGSPLSAGDRALQQPAVVRRP